MSPPSLFRIRVILISRVIWVVTLATLLAGCDTGPVYILMRHCVSPATMCSENYLFLEFGKCKHMALSVIRVGGDKGEGYDEKM